MITDLDIELARDCMAFQAGQYEPTWQGAHSHFLILKEPGKAKIIAKGTTDAKEWAGDLFLALPVRPTHDHETIGTIDLYWWQDVEPFVDEIIAALKAAQAQGLEICASGHSKGSPDVLYIAALAILAGVKFSRVSTFEGPHPGDLNGLITSDLGIDTVQRTDAVPAVPPWLSIPRARTHIEAPLPLFNRPDWGPLLINHHLENVISGLIAGEVK